MAAKLYLLLLVLCCFEYSVKAELPNGLHLALTPIASEMRAMWSLPSTPVSANLNGLCLFGVTPSNLSTFSAPSPAYTYSAGGFQGSLFNVVMENLLSDSLYYYKCGSQSTGFSSVYQFHTPPRPQSNASVKIVVWGDMGLY